MLLRKCIRLDELGIRIVADLGDSRQALDRLDELAPEIVCMDICMPPMDGIADGIALSEEILKRKPHTKIVIISGHDTFEYARRCIRLGVVDYLLKPIHEEQLMAVMRRVLAQLPKPQEDLSLPSTIRRVIDYVNANYCTPGLSLRHIAQRFYVNPSYLSRIFKQETGETLIEYLTRLRMQEAIRLFRARACLGYEAAEAVGITDAKYFGACFKKYTGVTLQEFRREIGNTNT
jgi:YesN/AraC family two-component response regulator